MSNRPQGQPAHNANTEQTELTHEAVIAALGKYVRPITATMGPGGRNVFAVTSGGRNYGKDGVTVGVLQHYADTPVEEFVSSLTREAQALQMQKVGDGTSTTAFFVDAFYRALAGTGMIPHQVNYHHADLEQGIKDAWDEIKEEMPLEHGALFDLAMVASHGDVELSQTVAEAQMIAGRRGFIYGKSYREAYAEHDQVEQSSGVFLPSGWAVRALCNNEGGQRLGFHVDGPCYWVISGVPLKDPKGIEAVFKYLNRTEAGNDRNQGGFPVVFIAPEIDQATLAKIMAQAQQNTGDDRARQVGVSILGGMPPEMVQDVVEDLAAVINPDGFYFSAQHNRFLSDIGRLAQETTPVALTLGKVSILTSTTDVELTEEAAARAKKRASDLRAESDLERAAGNTQLADAMDARAARLMGEFPTILLKAGSESDMVRRAQLLDDAIRTTQTAVREGRVPAQGLAYVRLNHELLVARNTNPLTVNIGAALMGLRDHVVSLMLSEFDDTTQEYRTKIALSDGSYVEPGKVGAYDSAAIGINAILTALNTAVQMYDTAYVLTEKQ